MRLLRKRTILYLYDTWIHRFKFETIEFACHSIKQITQNNIIQKASQKNYSFLFYFEKQMMKQSCKNQKVAIPKRYHDVRPKYVKQKAPEMKIMFLHTNNSHISNTKRMAKFSYGNTKLEEFKVESFFSLHILCRYLFVSHFVCIQ